MKLLFLRYNKVTNDAFNNLILQSSESIEVHSVDLSQYDKYMDILNYSIINDILVRHEPYDIIITGDIFWTTGQNICKWGELNNKPVCFLQHGQWKYIENKKNPRYLPKHTCLYGQDVTDMCKSWPYSKRSQVHCVGSPRYDDITLNKEGEGVYFSPPVICEYSPSAPEKIDKHAQFLISRLHGIDDKVKLVLQPHYREGRVSLLKMLFPKAIFIDPSDDPFKWIKQCNKVLTHRDSTVVLDAIAHGKLTVLMNFDDEKVFFNRGYFGDFAVESSSAKNCFTHLQSDLYLRYNDYIKKVKKYIYLGNASRRILDILEN